MPHVVLNEAYDALGDRTSLAATIAGTADFSNSYSYDADQNLTMVQQQGVSGGNIVSPKEVDYGYNAIGAFTTVADFNFIGVGPREDVLSGTYSYDNGARLTGLAYTSDGGTNTIDTLGWGYDPANNVTSFSSIDGTASYGYDPTNQLTSASYTTAQGGHQPANESFSFDANGNRNSTGYTTGSDNLMSSDGTFNYQHDADGNTTVRTRISDAYATDYTTTYTWDYRNRLTDVEYYDNNSLLTKHVHYVYGVFDHLIATEVDPNGGGTYTDIQHYVLDVSPEIPVAGVPGTATAQPDLVFDGNGNLIQRNLVTLDPARVDAVLVQGTVASLTQGDNDIFVAYDNLGTPRDDVDGTGTLVNHKVFSVFGQDVYDSNTSIVNWAGFAGGHDDPNTGLVNDGNRWYNAATGSWESSDPEGFAAGDANLDRYAANNPASLNDPTGLTTNGPSGSGFQGLITIGDVQAGNATQEQYQAQQKQINADLQSALAVQAQVAKAAQKARQDEQKEQGQLFEMEVKNQQHLGDAEMKLNLFKLYGIEAYLQDEKILKTIEDFRKNKEEVYFFLKYEYKFGPNGPR